MNEELRDLGKSVSAPPEVGHIRTATILFKVPQEAIQDIELTLSVELTIDQVKRQIERRHPLKPRPAKQKIFFAGKLLSSPTDTLLEILVGVSSSSFIS